MADEVLWINESPTGGVPLYTAGELRRTHALPVIWSGSDQGAREGIRIGGDQWLVELSDFDVTIHPGVAVISPDITPNQGPYWASIPNAEEHVLDPADATNPRIDRAILRVYDDDQDFSGLRLARTEILTGTPAPAPVIPSVPTGAISLARIDVPADGQGNPTVTHNASFTAGLGGVLPLRNETEISTYLDFNASQLLYNLQRSELWVSRDDLLRRVREVLLVESGDRPSNPSLEGYVGQPIFESDTGRLLFAAGDEGWVLPRNVAGGRVDSYIITTNSSDTSGGTPLTIITSDALTPSMPSRVWKVEFFASALEVGAGGASGSGDRYFIYIRDNGSDLNRCSINIMTSSGPDSQRGPVHVQALLIGVSVAAHTFTVEVQRVEGDSGNAHMRAGADHAARLLITDVGVNDSGLATT